MQRPMKLLPAIAIASPPDARPLLLPRLVIDVPVGMATSTRKPVATPPFTSGSVAVIDEKPIVIAWIGIVALPSIPIVIDD